MHFIQLLDIFDRIIWKFIDSKELMDTQPIPRWLEWAREIQSLSQTGRAFALTEYEKQRYQRLSEIAAEIVHDYTDLPVRDLRDNFISQPGYATPKVDVRGAVIRENKILLVKEVSDGRWSMPGGWADVGDMPSEVAAREVFEESGFEVKPKKVIGVFDANRSGRPLEFYHAYKIIFLCELIGGKARPSDETSDVGFFNFNDLPPLSTNRTNERHLKEVQLHLADPSRKVTFD